MRKKISLMFGAFLFPLYFLYAQAPVTTTSADLFLQLKKLKVLGTVLYIAAHPDDENSRLISYMVKDRLYRTGYLSMTRGDGGQNLIGEEMGIEMGLIRTQEMMAARRIDGAEQFFSRAYDFGFSKSTKEALNTWDEQKVLSDVVWVIRKFQPDIIVTRFPEDSRAGHGHHSASAVLAREAFTAAADPNRFPEQFKYGVSPWQAKRLFWNTFNFGNSNTTSEDQMKIDVGGYNAAIGKSYGEIAAESRTQHKSQGAALVPARGESMEYFTLIEGDSAHKDPMEGIITSWDRIENGSEISMDIDKLLQNYSILHPENSVPGLVELYKKIASLKDGYWKNQKLKEVQSLIKSCSGLWLEATVHNAYVAQGDSLVVLLTLNNRGGSKIALKGFYIESSNALRLQEQYSLISGGKVSGWKPSVDTMVSVQLGKNKNLLFNESFRVPESEPISQPYWLVEPMSPGSYNINDQSVIGNPEDAPSYQVFYKLDIEGQEFRFSVPLRYKYTDPVKGERYEPLRIVPAFTVQVSPPLLLFSNGLAKSFEADLQRNSKRPIVNKLALTPTKSVFTKMDSQNSNQTHFIFSAQPSKAAKGLESLYLLSTQNNHTDTLEQMRTISYDHIPRIDYFKKAEVKFLNSSVKIIGKHIGYIEGVGDKVPQALQQMGYNVQILTEKDITAQKLSQLDAVITGVRAYDVKEWLAGKYELLMDFVKKGGNLIVQYNRNNIGNSKIKIGPYPFSISSARVTDENAEVTFIHPSEGILNFPNKIGSADFQGWVQERGIYFINQLDSNYHTVLSMHDPGEPAQIGSLVYASYGKGKFVYTGLVFFRELPAGVSGAYRLLANIIALNHK